MAVHTTEKVQRYRDRMIGMGMRQINLWVPDARSPKIAEEARRQSLLVAADPAPEEAGFLDAFEQDMGADEEWTE